MEFQNITVTAPDQSERPAKLAVCDCNPTGFFMVFQIEGQGHFHLQCVLCGTSFCPFGVCPADAACVAGGKTR